MRHLRTHNGADAARVGHRAGSGQVGRVALALLAAAVGLSGCTYLVGSWGGGTSTEEAGRDRLIFSHKKHVVDEGTACGDCHGDIAKSEGLEATRHLPVEKACMECHEREDNCKMCHANPKAPVKHLDRRMKGIVFSHKAHVARTLPGGKKVDCESCHNDVRTATRVSQDRRPAMFATCGQCHQKTFRQEDCRKCHSTLPETGPAPTTVFDHGGDWMRRHGTAAKGAEMVCAHCHSPDTCVQCHGKANIAISPDRLNLDKVARGYPHRGDFLARHPTEARVDPKRCQSCHSVSHCTECHTEMGVFAKERGVGNPHPASWLAPKGGAEHGREARRNPMACAACHDAGAASNCVTCHRVGAPGGNPHPVGWKRDEGQKSSPACTPCHG